MRFIFSHRLLAAGLLTGGLAFGASADDFEVPTAETDPLMARNLAAMMKQPGVLDLEWRQPKEAVEGAARPLPAVTPDAFPAPEALASAHAYSDANSGKGMLVWYRGKLVDAYFAEGVTEETFFGAFSMHKSVLALMLLAAVEDGMIGSLDDATGTYIPEWRDDARGDITLRQLLQQTSGLAHYTTYPGPTQNPKAAALSLSSQVSATALSYPLAKEPGSEFSYNNVNSQVLGIALANALAGQGLRYSDYLSERLWKPLGNADAVLWLEAEGGSPRYYAGLNAGLADWLRIGIMLAQNGEVDGTPLLQPDSVAQLFEHSPVNPRYSLNTWLGGGWKPERRYGPTTPSFVPHAEPYLAPDVLFYDGFGGQRVYVVPSAELVIARFGEVELAFDDSVIPNTLLRGLLDARMEDNLQSYQSDEALELYMERYEQLLEGFASGRGLSGYDTMVPMPGDRDVEPLPRGDAPWLSDETEKWLRELGAGNNTQALMVWHDGDVVFEDYPDAAPDDLVTSRSLSKPLSVIAVGRAIKEGFIDSLDQSVADFLTPWQGTDKADITLRHLLQMRSGLAPQGNSPDPDDVMNRAYLHPYHIEVILREYPLVLEPGSRYDYSNANAELIAPIIEYATGRPYEDWVSEAVLEPLGARGGEIWADRIGGTVHSGCCAALPAETYLRMALLFKQDGVWEGERLLPEGFVETATTPTPYNPHAAMGIYVAGPYVEGRGAANPDIPLGKTKHGEPYLDKDLYLFDGNGNQVVYVVPRHDLVALRVGSRPPKDNPWDNSLLPNYLLRQLSDAAGAELLPQPGP